jgi:hypothetical protein
MIMKSKKDLFEALDQFFQNDKYTSRGLEVVGNETYGRQSMIYVDAGDEKTRWSLEWFLKDHGFKTNTAFMPKGKTVEVQVSYFRGFGWSK